MVADDPGVDDIDETAVDVDADRGLVDRGRGCSSRTWRFGKTSVMTEKEARLFFPGGGAMERTVTVRTELEAILVEQALVMARELEAALRRQAEASGKKGRPAGPAPAAGRGRSRPGRPGRS